MIKRAYAECTPLLQSDMSVHGKGSKNDFATWCRICVALVAPDTKKTCIKKTVRKQ